MHAIILAAGRGNRLAGFNPDRRPKCLLEFGGRSLLERQLDRLFREGVGRVTLVVGHEADLIIDHVSTLGSRPDVAFVYNPAYTDGSVLSLLAAEDALNNGEPVLVMDADLLFHPEILQRLIQSPHPNCFLLDQDFIPGDEPVKIAVNRGQMIELRKSLSTTLEYEILGESVGFFKFDGETAGRIARKCNDYKTEGLIDAPHEEVLRDLLLARSEMFEYEDISGLPWVEIDFPEDVELAVKQVLPAIRNKFTNY